MKPIENSKRKLEKIQRTREESKKLLDKNFLLNPPDLKRQSQGDQSTEQSKVEQKKIEDDERWKPDEIRKAVDRLNKWDKEERLKALPPRRLSSEGENGLRGLTNDKIADIMEKYKDTDPKDAQLNTYIDTQYPTLNEREKRSLAKVPVLAAELKQNQDEMSGLKTAQAYLDQFKKDLNATKTTNAQGRKVVEDLLKDINLLKESFNKSHSKREIRVDHLKSLLRINDSKEIKDPKKTNEVNKLTDMESDSKLTKLKKLSENQEQKIKELTEKIGILDSDIIKITNEKSNAEDLHNKNVEEKNNKISDLERTIKDTQNQLEHITQEKSNTEDLHNKNVEEKNNKISDLERTIKDTQNQLETITNEKSNAEKPHMEQIKKHDNKISELENAIKDTQNQLEHITQEKSNAEKQHKEQIAIKDQKISDLIKQVDEAQNQLEHITQEKSNAEKQHKEQIAIKDQKISELQSKLDVRSGILASTNQKSLLSQKLEGLTSFFSTSPDKIRSSTNTNDSLPVSHSPTDEKASTKNIPIQTPRQDSQRRNKQNSNSPTSSRFDSNLNKSSYNSYGRKSGSYSASYRSGSMLSRSHNILESQKLMDSFEEHKKQTWEALQTPIENQKEKEEYEKIVNTARETLFVEHSRKIAPSVEAFFTAQTKLTTRELALTEGKNGLKNKILQNRGKDDPANIYAEKQMELMDTRFKLDEKLTELEDKRTELEENPTKIDELNTEITTLRDESQKLETKITTLQDELKEGESAHEQTMKEVRIEAKKQARQDKEMQKFESDLKSSEVKMLELTAIAEINIEMHWGMHNHKNNIYRDIRQNDIFRALSGDQLRQDVQDQVKVSTVQYPLTVGLKGIDDIHEKIDILFRNHLDLITARRTLRNKPEFLDTTRLQDQEGKVLNELKRNAEALQATLDKIQKSKERGEVPQKKNNNEIEQPRDP